MKFIAIKTLSKEKSVVFWGILMVGHYIMRTLGGLDYICLDWDLRIGIGQPPSS